MMVDVNEKVIWEECHKRYQALESKGLENVHGSGKLCNLLLWKINFSPEESRDKVKKNSSEIIFDGAF